MSDPEKKICRYFNTLGGCWYGDSCKFLHIPNKKPPCKFYGSSSGCRYGESCHFSHDRTPFKSVENYSNPPVELMKEVFKENVDPSELSGTNNNNMTQPMSAALVSCAQTVTSAAENTNNKERLIVQSPPLSNTANGPSDSLAADSGLTADNPDEPATQVYGTTDEATNCYHSATETVTLEALNMGCSVQAGHTITSAGETLSSIRTTSPTVSSTVLSAQPLTMDAVTTAVITRMSQELNYREPAGQQSMTKLDSMEQNYTLMPMNGRSNGNMANEIEIYCGSCKRVLERQGNESYCTLLKDHYLECFLDKEGDHVKYVKTKAALEPGQMYWCKSCILIFEKPWSLFQHMADKAKGSKVQRWEKKIHLDWLDNVAGLMAGYDLGLFSPAKLRIDLRNLLADQHTVEEEMEAAAVTAAAMMQWLAPLSSPWRLQQREMMRKIEQLNRQMLRKANLGLNGPVGGYPMRAALTAAPASATTSPSINYMGTNRPTTGSLPATPAPPVSSAPNPQRIPEMTISDTRFEVATAKFPTKCTITQVDGEQLVSHRSSEMESKDNNDSSFVGPLGDGNSTRQVVEEAMLSTNEAMGSTGAAGDTVASISEQSTPKHPSESTEVTEQTEPSNSVVDSNNTNSVHTREQHAFGRSDDGGRRVEFKRGYNSAPVYGYSGSKLSNSGGPSSGSKGYNDSIRYQVHSRGSRTPGYGHSTTSFSTANHRAAMYRANRLGSGPSVPPSRGANTFNPPSFHASLDFNCGFTDEEVEELLSQGIRPWDSEAAAALAVLHGELDHLLD